MLMEYWNVDFERPRLAVAADKDGAALLHTSAQYIHIM